MFTQQNRRGLNRPILRPFFALALPTLESTESFCLCWLLKADGAALSILMRNFLAEDTLDVVRLGNNTWLLG